MEVDLSKVSDEDLYRERRKRAQAEERARHEAAVREAKLAREMQEGKDAEFAKGIGITYQQYEEVESYVRDKVEAER